MKYLFELLFWHKKKWELVWSQCWNPARSLLRWWTKKILGVVKGERNHFNDSQQYLLSYQSISRASAQKGERREEERENWRSSTHISTPCAIDTINLLRFKHEHYQLFQLFLGGLDWRLKKNWNSSGSELCWFCSLALVTLNMTIVYTYVQPCSNHRTWSICPTHGLDYQAKRESATNDSARKIIITCWFVQTANGHDEMLTLSISLLSLWSNDWAYPKNSMKNTKTWSGKKWRKK